MKTIKNILFIFLIGLSFISCEKAQEREIQSSNAQPNIHRMRDIDDEDPPLYTEEDAIVLGNQRSNPYEITNMLHAYEIISCLLPNFVVGTEEPEVNTIYYRVLPTDSADLAILDADTSIIYFDYPLDYDIVQWGNYYHDPTVSDPAYTWLYAVVPAGHPLPQLSTVQILQECYLPEEPSGNDDSLYDTIPDWQNGFALLEYVAYRESGNSDMFEPEDIDNLEYILDNSLGWGEENGQAQRSSRSFWSWLRGWITGVHPQGQFRVRNTETGANEPIKNAKVLIHNFIKIYCGGLNSNGFYYSTTRFRTRSWYHIRFENHNTGTRIYNESQFIFGPVHRRLGWHSRDGYSCTLYFGDMAWRYASINNAAEKYLNYCQEYSIFFPYNLRIWVVGIENDMGVASTPLFHKRGVPLAWGAALFSPLLSIILAYRGSPDMVFCIPRDNYSYNTRYLYYLVFHEFGHGSHYMKVGNAYWSNYVLYIIENLGYGYDAHGDYAGYCGIGEMWGNFVGACFANKYLGHSYPYLYIDYDGYQDITPYSNQHYVAFNAWEDWYHPGILAKIHEDSGCSITDIYNALNVDVYSLDALELTLQSEGIDRNIISEAYGLYHHWDPRPY